MRSLLKYLRHIIFTIRSIVWLYELFILVFERKVCEGYLYYSSCVQVAVTAARARTCTLFVLVTHYTVSLPSLLTAARARHYIKFVETVRCERGTHCLRCVWYKVLYSHQRNKHGQNPIIKSYIRSEGSLQWMCWFIFYVIKHEGPFEKCAWQRKCALSINCLPMPRLS